MPTVHRPDLSEQFILVDIHRRVGIVEFNEDHTKVRSALYWFDEDGDLFLTRKDWKPIVFIKGRPAFTKRCGSIDLKFFLDDMTVPPENPYA